MISNEAFLQRIEERIEELKNFCIGQPLDVMASATQDINKLIAAKEAATAWQERGGLPQILLVWTGNVDGAIDTFVEIHSFLKTHIHGKQQHCN